jgi:hypothetical protein
MPENGLPRRAGWKGGAIPGKDFLALMEKVDFVEVELPWARPDSTALP